MSSAFYNDDRMLQEAAAVREGREAGETEEIEEINDVSDVFEVELTARTIFENQYKLIALQFPDEMLFWAPSVMILLKKSLKVLDSDSSNNNNNSSNRKIYILADSSYAPCCVDEIAAEHMKADFIVHYGRACMSKVTRLPAMYVFGKKKIDTTLAAQSLSQQFSSSAEKVLVFYDVGYNYSISELEKKVNLPNSVIFTRVETLVKGDPNIKNNCNNNVNCCQSTNSCGDNNDNNNNINNTENNSGCCGGGSCQSINEKETEKENENKSLDSTTPQTDNPTESNNNNSNSNNNNNNNEDSNTIRLNGRSFELFPGTELSEYTFLYIGEDDPTLSNLMITNNKNQFFIYNPTTQQLQKQIGMSKNIMRRYHLIEKTRDADIIGIVVATLGVAGYLDVIQKLQEVIKAAGKKYYTIVVGKLNEFKLGNFQEIDIFVLVACTENTLIDSKNYYKPVITPFELEIALVRGKEWTGDYKTAFEHVLKDAPVKVEDEDTEETALRYSLGTQKLMRNPKHIDIEVEGSTDIATRNNNLEMMTNSFATTFLNSRSWRGLEQQIGETPVSAPVEGRSGIASVYQGEPK